MLGSLLQFATCTIRGYTPYHNQSQTGMLDYTGEKYDTLPPGLPANLIKIKIVKVKNLLANTRSVLPAGANVAVLCVRFRPHNNLQFHEGGSCALWRVAAATQFAVGWHKALQQCQEPLKRLQTQKDSYDTDTDVRESYEIQEKVKKKELSLQRKATAAPSSRQDLDEFRKCECMESSSFVTLCSILYYFSIMPLMK